MNLKRETKITKQYLAGILDGEGCICFVRHNKGSRNVSHVVRVLVVLSDRGSSLDVLREFKKRYGGGLYKKKLYHNKKSFKSNHPTWVFELSRKLAVKCLRDLLPHLVIKREQAELLVSAINETKSKKKGLLPEELTRREQIYARMRILNS